MLVAQWNSISQRSNQLTSPDVSAGYVAEVKSADKPSSAELVEKTESYMERYFSQEMG